LTNEQELFLIFQKLHITLKLCKASVKCEAQKPKNSNNLLYSRVKL